MTAHPGGKMNSVGNKFYQKASYAAFIGPKSYVRFQKFEQ